MVRVLALVACGTRTIIDAVFGTDRIGELGYAQLLLRSTQAGMIVLADRNFAAAAWRRAISEYVASTARGHHRAPSRPATINIDIEPTLTAPPPA